jgi:hypothetical protein
VIVPRTRASTQDDYGGHRNEDSDSAFIDQIDAL